MVKPKKQRKRRRRGVDRTRLSMRLSRDERQGAEAWAKSRGHNSITEMVRHEGKAWSIAEMKAKKSSATSATSNIADGIHIVGDMFDGFVMNATGDYEVKGSS